LQQAVGCLRRHGGQRAHADLRQGVVVTPEEELHNVPMTYRHGGIVSPYVDFREPLSVQDRHFVDSRVRNKTPLTDGRAGLAVVQVPEAADRALRSKRPEPVTDVPTARPSDAGGA
jgi:hypothetical protein